MRVFSLKRLREFWQIHPDAEVPLRRWHRDARREEWRSIQEVRLLYPHADGVRTANNQVLTVFNIGGNKYRLVVDMLYSEQRAYVRAVLTHAEYDRSRWKF